MDKKVIFAIAAVLLTSAILYSVEEKRDSFLEWKQQFNVAYSNEEDAYRRLIFLKNLEIIEKHNSDSSKTYRMGLNQFSALHDSEFEATFLNPRVRKVEHSEDVSVNAIVGDADWVSAGKVSPVKNQGNCGSCWAFSAVGVLESWALFKNQVVNLSEQQIVDCSKSYGNEGCNGGFNYKGLAYVKDHGLSTESQYPYTAKTGPSCKINSGDFKISSVTTVKGCAAVQTAIQSHPIGVSADATNWSRYASGIFNNCGRNLNHDILLVGYTSAYYTIKNSWGAAWGEKGFIRLAPGNTCGICDDLSPWVN